MTTPIVRNSGSRNSSFAALPASSAPEGTTGSTAALAAATHRSPALALSVEFVAKPEKAAAARAFLPAAIQSALKEVDSFAGCVVLGSEQEARLITVITFWTGSDSRKRCAQNARWVHALLSTYVDRRLRVQTLLAHAPAVLPEQLEEVDEMSAQTGSILQERGVAEGNVCVA